MMRLVSLHLSNDRILWGHVLLEDTEDPMRTLRRSLSAPSIREPGYELYDWTNTVLSDLSVPAVREANRIVQTLLIPASEIAKREKASSSVSTRATWRGSRTTMPWQSQLWMYARGEVTREQLSAYADEGRQIPANLTTPPSVRPTFPRTGGRPHRPAFAGTSLTPPTPRQKPPRPCRSASKTSVSYSKRTG